MYLLHCDLLPQPYSVDYTLVGIYSSKEDAIKAMKDYNEKLKAFKKENKALIEKAQRKPYNDKAFEDFVIKSDNFKSFDYDKLDKHPEVVAKLDKIYMELERLNDELNKKALEKNLITMERNDATILFEFDLNDKDSYIDEFNGKPISICSYEEWPKAIEIYR